MGLSFNFLEQPLASYLAKKIRGDTWLHIVWGKIFDLDLQKGSLYIRL